MKNRELGIPEKGEGGVTTEKGRLKIQFWRRIVMIVD